MFIHNVNHIILIAVTASASLLSPSSFPTTAPVRPLCVAFPRPRHSVITVCHSILFHSVFGAICYSVIVLFHYAIAKSASPIRDCDIGGTMLAAVFIIFHLVGGRCQPNSNPAIPPINASWLPIHFPTPPPTHPSHQFYHHLFHEKKLCLENK